MTSFDRTILGLTAAFSLTILVGSGVVITTAHAQGQDKPGKPGKTGRGGQGGRVNNGAIQQALKAVKLTPEQETKVKDLTKQFREDTKAVGPDATPEARRSKSSELLKKMMADIEAILTPEQKTQFKEELKKAQAESGSPMGMLEGLDLTPEQKEKVQPIVKETMEEVRMVREDSTLDQKAKMQKSKELMDAMRSKIRPILTAEQQKKFDEMKMKPGRGGQGGRRGRGGQGGSQI